MMPSPKFTVEDVQPIVALVEKHLAAGARPPGRVGHGRSAVEAAAAEARSLYGMRSHASVRRRLQAADELGVGVDWTLYKPPQYQKPLDVRRQSPIYEPAPYAQPSGKIVRVCVIPDIHISPTVEHDRMLWIGRWCHDRQPDFIVQLGDWLTLDSLSTHADVGTITRNAQPAFADDLAAGEASMDLFFRGLNAEEASTRPRLVINYGNHEFRAHRFEDKTPELEGTIIASLDRLFTQRGWRPIPYGEFFFIEGVGFIHHVNNTMGRAYGGKTSAQRIANDSVFSVVHGHTHQKQSVDIPKIGPNLAVRAISAGCALPYGHIEDYAKHSTTGWWWGCLFLTICDGQIIDEHWDHMMTLEEKYSD